MIYKFKRYIVMTDKQVDGFYKYKDTFVILPPPYDAPKPSALMGHYPCVIEFKYPFEIDDKKIFNGSIKPDEMQDMDLANKAFAEILNLLSIFTRTHFFVYSSRQAWYKSFERTETGISTKIAWGQEMYEINDFQINIDSFSEITFTELKVVGANEYFSLESSNTLNLPDNFPVLLDKYFKLSGLAKKAFMTSAKLFTQGVELYSKYPSLSFAAFVSAIETLVVYDHKDHKVENCLECKQPKYGPTKKFVNFFLKYGENSKEFKKFANKIYETRSKILHRGTLFPGEVEPNDFGYFDSFDDRVLKRSLLRTCRICIINWLLLLDETQAGSVDC